MKNWIKYVRPYMSYFILGPVCMIVEVIGEVILPEGLEPLPEEEYEQLPSGEEEETTDDE